MTIGEPGLFTISGTWASNGKHGIVGQSYRETIGGTNVFTGVLSGKATATKRVLGKVGTNIGQLSLRGVPFTPPPDLSGNWNVTTVQNKMTSSENYTLTPTSDTGVFDVSGSGSGYTISGKIIITARNAVNAFIVADYGVSGQVTRSLSGNFSPTSHSLSLKGLTGHGDRITLHATRQ
jgi:hypothetical protein